MTEQSAFGQRVAATWQDLVEHLRATSLPPPKNSQKTGNFAGGCAPEANNRNDGIMMITETANPTPAFIKGLIAHFGESALRKAREARGKHEAELSAVKADVAALGQVGLDSVISALIREKPRSAQDVMDAMEAIFGPELAYETFHFFVGHEDSGLLIDRADGTVAFSDDDQHSAGQLSSLHDDLGTAGKLKN